MLVRLAGVSDELSDRSTPCLISSCPSLAHSRVTAMLATLAGKGSHVLILEPHGGGSRPSDDPLHVPGFSWNKHDEPC